MEEEVEEEVEEGKEKRNPADIPISSGSLSKRRSWKKKQEEERWSEGE